MKRVGIVLLILFFIGCGYKPSRLYVQEFLGDAVATHIKIYLRDPQNAMLIKDAVNEALMERFGVKIDKNAKTKLNIAIKSVHFVPLQYDNNGYVVTYRTKVLLDFVLNGKRITTDGLYDFAIEPNTIITDTMRYIAIKEAASKAIEKFLARLSFVGVH